MTAANRPESAPTFWVIRDGEAVEVVAREEYERVTRERDDFEQRLHAYKSGEIA